MAVVTIADDRLHWTFLPTTIRNSIFESGAGQLHDRFGLVLHQSHRRRTICRVLPKLWNITADFTISVIIRISLKVPCETLQIFRQRSFRRTSHIRSVQRRTGAFVSRIDIHIWWFYDGSVDIIVAGGVVPAGSCQSRFQLSDVITDSCTLSNLSWRKQLSDWVLHLRWLRWEIRFCKRRCSETDDIFSIHIMLSAELSFTGCKKKTTKIRLGQIPVLIRFNHKADTLQPWSSNNCCNLTLVSKYPAYISPYGSHRRWLETRIWVVMTMLRRQECGALSPCRIKD